MKTSASMEYLKFLGQGSQGTVRLAVTRNGSRRRFFAVKSSPLSKSESLQKEGRILKHLADCPYVVRCYGDEMINEAGGFMEYKLILEYAPGGNLADFLDSRGGKLPENTVGVLTRMILDGLCTLHDRGFVHCDLKPENILVFLGKGKGKGQDDEDGNGNSLCRLKIADFGLSKEPDEETKNTEWKYRFRGTPAYMSPESVTDGDIRAPLDIWSLGCVVLVMLTGALPWDYLNIETLLAKFVFGNVKPPPVPESLSATGKDFLSKCFLMNPDERWDAHKLRLHPFVLPSQS